MNRGRDSGFRSYQESLRKLGAWLDTAAASQVNVLELSNGFAIRYQEAPTDNVAMQRVFTHEEIRVLRWGDLGLSRRFWRRFGKGRGLTRESGGYQDLFRALGYELDSAEALCVMLDENDREDTVTLSYRKPSPGPEEDDIQTVVLGPREREDVKRAARARRQAAALWRR